MGSDHVTIRLTGVSKSFGETRALRGIDFEAMAGEVHAVVGENGSGKSTLAKIISGVLLPDSGEVRVLGSTFKTPIDTSRLGVATIFQEILVADDASVLDNLYVGRDPFLSIKPSNADRIREATLIMERLVGAPVDFGAPVGGLSLSVKQWIVIARAILRRPKVLILDESSAALDLAASVRLYGAIKELRDVGTTILIVTHRIAELVRIADRATILRDGEKVGCLEGSSITEESLLSLMTPSDRIVADARNVVRVPRKTSIPSTVAAERIALVPNAAPFSFSIEQGQIVGITGLEGHGHDTFVRALAGISAPVQGEIRVKAQDGIQSLDGLASAERLGVAYVSGDRKREGIFPDLTIFENLAIGVYSKRRSRLGIIHRAGLDGQFQEEVDRLSIKTGRSSDKITSLSGGNQQKVLIGRAFARDPKVIVLNDPARGVDLGTKRDLYLELRRFAEKGGAVVYLSSEIEEFFDFADRVDVFVDNTLFRSLSGDAINEHDILAAMFAQPGNSPVVFSEREVAL